MRQCRNLDRSRSGSILPERQQARELDYIEGIFTTLEGPTGYHVLISVGVAGEEGPNHRVFSRRTTRPHGQERDPDCVQYNFGTKVHSVTGNLSDRNAGTTEPTLEVSDLENSGTA